MIIHGKKANNIQGGNFMEFKQWNNFKDGEWKYEINVRSFIQSNYTP